MDIVTNFKQYLLAEKKPPSSITIKNYLADVRKFLTWYSDRFQIPFIPTDFTRDVIVAYQTAINSRNNSSYASARSAKRYISSLRRFADFFVASGVSNSNPFSNPLKSYPPSDPYFINEFKGFLFTEHAKNVTIKNYSADLKQFIDWLTRVTNEDVTITDTNFSSLLASIDNIILEQYKIRLLNEAKLSPLSINRKLSSIRRYIRWLSEKGIITNNLLAQEDNDSTYIKGAENNTVSNQPIMPVMPLIALQGLAEEEKDKNQRYSNFAPIRLIQKTSKLISLGTDLVLFNPLAHVAEAVHFSFGKIAVKQYLHQSLQF